MVNQDSSYPNPDFQFQGRFKNSRKIQVEVRFNPLSLLSKLDMAKYILDSRDVVNEHNKISHLGLKLTPKGLLWMLLTRSSLRWCRIEYFSTNLIIYNLFVSLKLWLVRRPQTCCREPIFECLYLTVFTGKSNMGEVLLGFVMPTFIPFPDSSLLEGYMIL